MPVEKKKVALVCVLLVVAIAPLVLLSTPCLKRFEKGSLPRSGGSGSPKTLLRVAWIYRSTLRPADAKRAYNTFYTIFPNHHEAIYAHWQYVLLVKETDPTSIRQHTREALEVFVAKWKGHPRYREFEQDVQKTWLYTKRL